MNVAKSFRSCTFDSIGSLGKSGNEVKVENISVIRGHFNRTTNGVRIKTWQVGRGHVRGVSFKSIDFTDVKNPIIIDQYYCDVRGGCKPTEHHPLPSPGIHNRHHPLLSSPPTRSPVAYFRSYVVGRSNHTHSQSSGIMEDRWTIFLISCIVLSGLGTSSASGLTSFNSFNVVNFGAAGDGKTDDSQVFLKAWKAVCQSKSEFSILIIPERGTFLLNPATFSGPCHSSHIYVLVNWSNLHSYHISMFQGAKCSGPSALAFTRCDDLILNGLTHINSPRSHININNCKGVIVSNLHIIAPQTSPNTDGIDISGSSSIIIRNCTIGTGDDCIAIGGGSSNVNISGVTCGPGQGISIGALGRGGYDTVEEIHVRNCTFKGTMNGVRIKTWQVS
ncbi:hypothetical protein RHMOL_Rhmol08G0288000 [Rhododendron molle]|uniref:Uncharacterized protein n=1 Tax=Rhododendron molle TaxID=49168 RepID=A0ACC0MUT8_RHOML|nr:hypothetical protein RHMOL_Rhmol08G0288000 [Rhododendron molle]